MRGTIGTTRRHRRAIGALAAAAGVLLVGGAPVGASTTTSTVATTASPAAALASAVQATIAAPNFTLKGYENIDREGFKLGVATNIIYEAPDRTLGGPAGKPLVNTTIGTTKYLRETMLCPGGTKAYWWWSVPVPASQSGTTTAVGYLRQLLALPKVHQHGSTFTSTTLAPATNATYKLAFGPGKVLTVATVVVKDGYVLSASYRYSSPKAVLKSGITYLKIGTSPPVPTPPASLVFASPTGTEKPPKPQASVVCAAH